MSKKNKRQTRKAAAAPAAAAAATPSTSTVSRAPGTGLPAFNPDYGYVIKDLRRIGLLAGTFITILVILSFILR